MSKTLEELGYEEKEFSNCINFSNEGEEIYLDKMEKTFSGQSFRPNGDFVEKVFTMEELKAIYKYCEDMGWINK